LLVPLQLSLSPMMLFAGRFEHALDVAVQCLHDADPRQHRRAAALGYLILAKHSFRRSSSERTCESMTVCNAVVPLLENSAETFLSRFCCQSRVATLVAFWAPAVALTYAVMQASAVEHILHS
jgi:hypothetical protein